MDKEVNHHKETINNHSFRLLYLQGGTFEMGEEDSPSYLANTPVHKVELSPFYMAEYLTTQALWKAVMGVENNPSFFKGDRRPVEQVSWDDIVEGNQNNNGWPAFLDQINELTKKTRPKGFIYRLPTEAEWEYAAKANATYQYSGSDKLKRVGWFDHNSHGKTKEVGLLQANNFGLFDMSGNVDEWCLDKLDYGNNFYEACYKQGIVKDPLCTEGHHRVNRGGSWLCEAQSCRTSIRSYWHPTYRGSNFGFRLVLASSSAEWRKQV